MKHLLKINNKEISAYLKRNNKEISAYSKINNKEISAYFRDKQIECFTITQNHPTTKNNDSDKDFFASFRQKQINV